MKHPRIILMRTFFLCLISASGSWKAGERRDARALTSSDPMSLAMNNQPPVYRRRGAPSAPSNGITNCPKLARD